VIPDQSIREQALDPERSFCVTAPAGSGKTELLTQRVLVLLTRVERPEQVLSITFTRKAAAEMRERICAALAAARAGSPVLSEHETITRRLAEAVLAHAKDRHWPIEDPEIFNIRTIDSLCHFLTRQMPLLSGIGGSIVPTDDSQPLYEAAVDALFAAGLNDSAIHGSLSALLLSFDNNWQRLRDLMVALLQQRGDWEHRALDTGTPENAEAGLLQAVTRLIEDSLEALRRRLGPGRISRLVAIVEETAKALESQRQAGELGRGALPPGPVAPSLSATMSCLDEWRWAANLLLTKTGPSFRKRLDKNCGFPTSEKARKADVLEFIEGLAEDRKMLPLWEELMRLPNIESGEEGWQLVMHLARVLPHLEAHLLLVFRERVAVDHTHVALAAEAALGTEDDPTDLALRLDYQLEHLLVDEFQDTSDSQFRLLTRLTQDWASHNAQGVAPRTVFLVGDGMQSIYRFRSANVGLFVRARDHGLGGLTLESLSLSSNFRSQGRLVDWVNRRFSRLLPDEDDPARGQIRHSWADAIKDELPGEPVEVHVFSQDAGRAEAAWITEQVKQLRADDPEASIAILGRGRRHLAPIVAALKTALVPLLGRDLEPLAHSPVASDLLSLCRWLANPADNVAAVALLRAPFVGLTVAEITQLLMHVDTPFSLLEVLDDASARLAADPTARCEVLRQALRWAEASRDRLGLAVWIEQIWLRLGGPEVIETSQWDDAEQFFGLLDDAEASGVGLDPEGLARLLDKRYVQHQVADNPVELLTLHKSKGLQFDYVFIPALTAGTRSGDRALLRWHHHQQADGKRALLIAADDGSEAGAGSLYQYLTWIDRQKDEAERRRLLYVGITRARRRVWLSGEVKDPGEWESPTKNKSLLGLVVGEGDVTVKAHVVDVQETSDLTTIPLWRRKEPRTVDSLPTIQSVGRPPLPSAAGNLFERAAGTALHRALELLSETRPLPNQHDTRVRNAVNLILLSTINDAGKREQVLWQVLEDVDRALADEKGRWLLGDHMAAASELSLLQLEEHGRELIVDRTFVDAEGVRWIVDYKSSRPRAEQTLEDFICEERERYSPQLMGYQKLLRALDDADQTVTVKAYSAALYFPAIGCLTVLDDAINA
jgi:ATP-dependent helicase/nuclease subunit A